MLKSMLLMFMLIKGFFGRQGYYTGILICWRYRTKMSSLRFQGLQVMQHGRETWGMPEIWDFHTRTTDLSYLCPSLCFSFAIQSRMLLNFIHPLWNVELFFLYLSSALGCSKKKKKVRLFTENLKPYPELSVLLPVSLRPRECCRVPIISL